MQRDKWLFHYQGAALKEACDVKVAYHHGRLEHWRTVFNEVKEKAGEGIVVQGGDEFAVAAGALVEEALDGPQERAAFSSWSNRRGYNEPQVMVDNTLQRKLGEAVRKVQEHAAKEADYKLWRRAFETHPTETYALNADDMDHFGL